MSEPEKQRWWQRWRGRGDVPGREVEAPGREEHAQEERAEGADAPAEATAEARPEALQAPLPPPAIPPEEQREPEPDAPPPEQREAGTAGADAAGLEGEAGREGWFRWRRADAGPGQEAREGWFTRLRAGLSRSSTRLRDNIAAIFTKRKLDAASLEELEDVLIMADLGVETAAELASELGRTRFGKEVSEQEVRGALAGAITEILEPVAKPLRIDPSHRPEVILVCGVNGTGKTTTIGKLAQQLTQEGRRVLLAAGDTFRAAAIEQLQIWGERTGCPVVAKPAGADAAGLAFDALQRARAERADVLLIDTAGRLHNKAALMDELAKVVRVLKKLDADAPHHTLLVLDATTGQNAHNQVETFAAMVPVSGLVVTKLDGTARGGVVVALAKRFGIPVHAVGVGEGVDDLRPFEARAFADALLGLEAA